MIAILEFIFRLVSFSVVLFFMLDYILVCQFPTKIGVAAVITATILTISVFLMFRVHIDMCNKCRRPLV